MNPKLTRLAYVLGAVSVSGIAAWASWHHQVEVALTTGEDPLVSLWVPLSVDGVLLVASAAMADDKARGRKPRMSAKVAFVIGVAASVGANIAAANPTLGARVVAAWPAIALLLVVEMLTRQGKPAPVIDPVIDPVIEPVKPSPKPVRPPAMKPVTPVKVAPPSVSVAPPVTDQVTDESVKPVSPAPRMTPPVLTRRDLVEAAMTANPDASAAKIGVIAGVSESTALRHMKAIRAEREASDPSSSEEAPAEMGVNGHEQPELLPA